MAAREAGKMSPAAVHTAAPIRTDRKKVAVPVAAQKAVEASPVIVDAGAPITTGYKRGETPVAAQNAAGAFPAAVDIRTSPEQENKKIVVFRATRKAGRENPSRKRRYRSERFCRGRNRFLPQQNLSDRYGRF